MMIDLLFFIVTMIIIHLILNYFLMQECMLYKNIIPFEMTGLLLKDNDII